MRVTKNYVGGLTARELAIKTIKDSAMTAFVSPALHDLQDVHIGCEGWAERLYDQIVNIQKFD